MELPVWQRLVARQKPHPDRGVQVPQVVAVLHASEGGGAGVPEQSDGSHDQSEYAQARLTGPFCVPT
jgi:hypothetical protein